ncbi:MAG: hypothetical protein HOP30_22740 [Cyclobacteriaceae bacterium]|nr:hypothetical protein [Cyclobacteriaceae bacterium]
MRKITLTLGFMVTVTFACYTQSVSRVDLKEKFLLSYIEEFIQKQSLSDSLFRKGLGFISLTVKPHSSKSDTVREYHLNTYYYDLKKTGLYPPCYTILMGRLVCIYFPQLSEVVNLSSKDKKKFDRLLESFLPKKQTIRFTTKDGKKVVDKSFRNEIVTIDGGKIIYLFKDGSTSMIDKSY